MHKTMTWAGLWVATLFAGGAAAQAASDALVAPPNNIDWVAIGEGGAVPEGGGFFIGVTETTGTLRAEIAGTALETVDLASVIDGIATYPRVLFVKVPGADGDSANVDLFFEGDVAGAQTQSVQLVAADDEAPTVTFTADDIELQFLDEQAGPLDACTNQYFASLSSDRIVASDHGVLVLDAPSGQATPAMPAGGPGSLVAWGETDAETACLMTWMVDLGLNVGQSDAVCKDIVVPDSTCETVPNPLGGCSGTEVPRGGALGGGLALVLLGASLRRRRR